MAGKSEEGLQIILAEYAHQEKRVDLSLTTVNNALNLYVAVMTILASMTAGAASLLWEKERTLAYLVIAMLTFLGAIATTLTLVRTYKARMVQTDADRALSRLRRYFVSNYCSLTEYLSDHYTDDWATPYTHRRQSAAFLGWLILIALSGLLVTGSIEALLLAQAPRWHSSIKVTIAVALGLLFAAAWLRWLNRRLDAKKLADQPRFPRKACLPADALVEPANPGPQPDATAGAVPRG